MKTTFTAVAIIFLLLGSVGTSLSARTNQSWKWVLLAQRKINYGLNSDIIEFGAREGRYTSLQLKVANGSLTMHSIQIEYRDGTRNKIELAHHFKPGNDTRLIYLKEHYRIIKSITIWYDTDSYSRNNATLLIFGTH